jgi:adenylate kinase family enzyme
VPEKADWSGQTRWWVIGASGSGKSTFARRVGAALGLATHDLDDVYRRRDGELLGEGEGKALAAGIAAGPRWVIEGVYGELAQVALSRATALVWLDLSWDVCREGLLQRGLHYGYNPDDPVDLAAWAEAHLQYCADHLKLYGAFGGLKTRLTTRAKTATFFSIGLPPAQR